MNLPLHPPAPLPGLPVLNRHCAISHMCDNAHDARQGMDHAQACPMPPPIGLMSLASYARTRVRSLILRARDPVNSPAIIHHQILSRVIRL